MGPTCDQHRARDTHVTSRIQDSLVGEGKPFNLWIEEALLDSGSGEGSNGNQRVAYIGNLSISLARLYFNIKDPASAKKQNSFSRNMLFKFGGIIAQKESPTIFCSKIADCLIMI